MIPNVHFAVELSIICKKRAGLIAKKNFMKLTDILFMAGLLGVTVSEPTIKSKTTGGLYKDDSLLAVSTAHDSYLFFFLNNYLPDRQILRKQKISLLFIHTFHEISVTSHQKVVVQCFHRTQCVDLHTPNCC